MFVYAGASLFATWRLFSLLALFGFALAAGQKVYAVTGTQTWTLQPGWNSISVEVEPQDPTPATVFAGLPIQMVWSYFPTKTPVQFIQNPSDPPWNVAGWNVYLPVGQPDAATLTNLFAIHAHQACLIKLSGSTPVQLTIIGTPTYKEISWRPDSFTLTGLDIAPNVTVQSGNYFLNSPAHTGQVRFRLDPNGTWIQLSTTASLSYGVAYWVYTKGSSDFSAPVQLSFGGSDRIDFGATLESKTLTLNNRNASDTTIVLNNPTGYPLVVASIDPNTNQTVWTPLSLKAVLVPANGTVTLTLGIRRAGLPANSDASLTASAQGIQRTIVVTAQNPVATQVGLWTGTVTLNKVSEAHTNPNVPTVTPAEFTMRLLLHVDNGGVTRLLKEAYIMKKPNPPGSNLANPGAFVLLSDPSMLALFQAPANHDGAPFAPRISAIGYDFSEVHVPLNGTFGTSLTGTILMPRGHPDNPFKHRYHPDHDDLTASFQPPPPNLPIEQQEVWDVTRALVLTFDPLPNDQAPSTGFSQRTGTYKETVTGLHKNNLITTGTFLLRRINTLGEINPAPAP
ncbi:MAG TPA: hypothetical protein VGM62_19350 [Chthoniobacterales bacterium]